MAKESPWGKTQTSTAKSSGEEHYWYDRLTPEQRKEVDRGIFWIREAQEPSKILGELGFRVDSEWCIFCGKTFAKRIPFTIQGKPVIGRHGAIYSSICTDCIASLR